MPNKSTCLLTSAIRTNQLICVIDRTCDALVYMLASHVALTSGQYFEPKIRHPEALFRSYVKSITVIGHYHIMNYPIADLRTLQSIEQLLSFNRMANRDNSTSKEKQWGTVSTSRTKNSDHCSPCVDIVGGGDWFCIPSC